MTAPQTTVSPPPEPPRKNPLNLTHVAAAALAAVTAALLGSQLGAAGTLIGAAGASVVTTVGTAVYQTSLERSRQRVRVLTQRTRSVSTSRAGAPPVPPPSAAQTTSIDDGSSPVGADGQTPPRQSWRRYLSLRYGAAVVAALGAFVLAMMAITGFEWASGETLGGHGKGTTIARVVNSPSGPQAPDPATPAAPSSSEVPTFETPSQTSEEPEPSTTPSAPSEDGTGDEPDLSDTPEVPEPSPVPPTAPLVPDLPEMR